MVIVLNSEINQMADTNAQIMFSITAHNTKILIEKIQKKTYVTLTCQEVHLLIHFLL